MSQVINLRAGDTEPLDMDVSATGLANLTEATSILAYFRMKGAATNHVNGVACTVVSPPSLRVRLDPVGAKNGGGNAFDAVGEYLGHLKITFSDGDISYFPADRGNDVKVVVTRVFG